MLKTKFWQRAAGSLPASVRERHRRHMERAERVEIALEQAIEIWSRLKRAIAH
jgi:hypothetical protein